MPSAKNEAQKMITDLPDDASLEDIQYHLYVLEKVQHGLDQIDAGQGIPHDQARARFGKWLSD